MLQHDVAAGSRRCSRGSKRISSRARPGPLMLLDDALVNRPPAPRSASPRYGPPPDGRRANVIFLTGQHAMSICPSEREATRSNTAARRESQEAETHQGKGQRSKSVRKKMIPLASYFGGKAWRP
ncbi:hypothetical protein EYF80_063300 [Liparis tanakae]|uniref:Uncharacterized protein n=1 Tax=Liparis tanakae TaxID=230148 RepID=A0A4Z2EDJ0_9TELE|nr:hypothetical protein EYF80_063300 [Liparis tanakae]